MTTEREQSQKAFEKLDPGDIDAAIELGSDICKELGICCTEKGKVMFQVFKRMRELKDKEAAAAAVKAAATSAAAAAPPGQPTEKVKEGGS